MAEKEVLLTPDGLKRLEEELNYLKGVKRKEVADRIKQAIEFGDISENSEYDEAKNEQAFVEGRILVLEKHLRNVRVINTSEGGDGVVSLGSMVMVKDLDTGEEFEYEIVGSVEADPANHRISNESPVGKALLHQKLGAVVDITVPIGILKYQVTGIRLPS
ncbi:MAG: transcription elongation factor GreA [Clostridia bacterium]|nr:MAG: transcription elongation factor GreA [Clostridia bacterium]